MEESHQYYQEAFGLLSQKRDKTKEEEELLIDLLIQWSYVFYYRGDFKGLVNLLKAHEQLAESLDDQARLGMFTAFTYPGARKQTVFLQVTILNSILMNLLFFRLLKRRKERSLSIALSIVIGIVESFLIFGGFVAASQWVFYKSLRWVGLQGYNLVALMLTALFLILSIPLLIRYRFSTRDTSVLLVGSFLLIRGALWISGYN